MKILLLMFVALSLDAQIFGPARNVRFGTTLPATCSTGHIFALTSAAPGESWYICIEGTWVLQSGGGGGGGGAPTTATYIMQTANGATSAEQALSALATGLLKNTTGTGVLSIAVANTDFAAVTHATRHQHGGADEIATATAAANAIPKAGAGGTLAATWIPDLSATYQPLDSDLTAVAALAANGMLARTGTGAFSVRTFAGTANEVTVTNGDGVAGPPTVSLPASIDLGGKALEIPNSTTLPGTCVVGQIYSDTDATAGQNIYLCTATNTWSLQSGTGVADPGANGLMVRTANLVSTARTIVGASGISVTDGTGVSGNPTITPDTAVLLSRSTAQGGADHHAVSASASATAYTAALATTLTAYTDGMHLVWEPDVACTGSTSTTLNVDSLGAKRIYRADGTSDPLPADCPANAKLALVYDGALTAGAGAFRIASVTNAIASLTAPVNVQTGTTYTLVAADNGKMITFNNASDITLTVPSGLGVGFNCLIVQLGTGEVIPSTSGTSVSVRGSVTKTAGQFAIATLAAYAANAFVLGGDLQ